MDTLHINTRLETLIIVRNRIQDMVISNEIDVTKFTRELLGAKNEISHNQIAARLEESKGQMATYTDIIVIIDQMLDREKKVEQTN